MCIDNIELLNRLTHHDDGSVDKKVFKTFLKQIGVYHLFKEVISEFEIDEFCKCEVEENGIIFNLNLNSEKSAKKAIKDINKKGNNINFKRRNYNLEASHLKKGNILIMILLNDSEMGDETDVD